MFDYWRVQLDFGQRRIPQASIAAAAPAPAAGSSAGGAGTCDQRVPWMKGKHLTKYRRVNPTILNIIKHIKMIGWPHQSQSCFGGRHVSWLVATEDSASRVHWDGVSWWTSKLLQHGCSPKHEQNYTNCIYDNVLGCHPSQYYIISYKTPCLIGRNISEGVTFQN